MRMLNQGSKLRESNNNLAAADNDDMVKFLISVSKSASHGITEIKKEK